MSARFRELVRYHQAPLQPPVLIRPRQRQRLVRGIFPWDLALPVDPGRTGLRQRFEDWAIAVRRLGAEPFVTFNHGGSGFAPSPGRYGKAFAAFLKAFGPNGESAAKVTLIAPWNEPNQRFDVNVVRRRKGKEQKETVSAIAGAATAARYFKKANQACHASGVRCKLVAGEFAGNMSPANQRYYERYFHELRAKPRPVRPGLFGVHIAGDVKRFQICNSRSAHKQINDRIRKRRQLIRERHGDPRRVRDFPFRGFCGPNGKATRARLLHEFRKRIAGREGAFRGARMWVTEVPTYRTLAYIGHGVRARLSFEDSVQCRAVNFLRQLPRVGRVYIYRFWDRDGPIIHHETEGYTQRTLVPRHIGSPLPQLAALGTPRPAHMDAFFNVKFLDGKCKGHAYARTFGAEKQWIGNYGRAEEKQMLSDVDGDSAADAVVYRKDDGAWFVARALARTMTFEGQTQWLGDHRRGVERPLMDDVNGDDKADAVVFDAGTWYVAISKPEQRRFEPEPGPWRQGFGVGADHVALSDVTGDGRADAVAYYPDGSWHVARAEGAAFVGDEVWVRGHGVGSEQQMLDDVNGDDVADAVVWDAQTGNWDVAVSNLSHTAFDPPKQWATNFVANATKPTLDDVTGDNVADAIIYHEGAWAVAPSTTSGFAGAEPWASEFGRGASERFVGDVTGDDKGDAVVFNAGGWAVRPAVP